MGDVIPPQEVATRRGSKRRAPAADWIGNVVRLQKSFALIYGTDTVFDGSERLLIRVGALRHAYGRAVKAWLESPGRKTIRQDEVVFDPRDPHRPYNLFGGLPSVPRKGDCDLILELVDYLCGGRPAIRDWVLNWMAYPLQHVGAKMATAIVMRGQQGCGKNMLWECVRSIYGQYGGMITQTELESQYNDFMSAKLFIIGNEVLSRRERWQLGGKLKNLVTEEQVPIQAKYMPTRLEANCCNLVFLSNDLLPVPLEYGDRRYLVVDTPDPHPDGREFYARVDHQIKFGGIAAFHRHLLDRDLGDFGPHTKPIRTEDFEQALVLSLSPSELFARRWKAGTLALLHYRDDYLDEKSEPRTMWAGSIADIYRLFRRWCESEGERHVDTETRLARTLQAVGFRKQRLFMNVGDGERRQHTVYYEPERVPDSVEVLEPWLKDQAADVWGRAHPVGAV